MAAAPGLGLRQRLGQSARITQQLSQAIGLLQLSNLELRAYVARELERNPLLEEAEDAGEARAKWLADKAPTFDMGVDALLSAIEEDHLSEAGDRDDAESGERRDDR